MATEMTWNQLVTDLGCITPPHTIANITGLKKPSGLSDALCSFSSHSGLGWGYLYLFVYCFYSKNVEQQITDRIDVIAPDANSHASSIKCSLKTGYAVDVSLKLREQLTISLHIIDNANTSIVLSQI
jgi:hypothetical protein